MTYPNITFLHTAPVHVATFDALMAEHGQGIPVRHIVEERLLSDARTAGSLTPRVKKRVHDILARAATEGAGVIVCTCSTLGECAESASNSVVNAQVIRIDRPMADAAVAQGSRILLVAALESTVAPSRELLLDSARRLGRSVEVTYLLCADAWSLFEAGDRSGYLQGIADQIDATPRVFDVVVLAQASMAGASDLLPNHPIPILSSPEIGVKAAVQAFQLIV